MELDRTYLAELAAELGICEALLESAMRRVVMRRRLMQQAVILGTVTAALPVIGITTLATGMARRFDAGRTEAVVASDREIGGELSESLPVLA